LNDELNSGDAWDSGDAWNSGDALNFGDALNSGGPETVTVVFQLTGVTKGDKSMVFGRACEYYCQWPTY